MISKYLNGYVIVIETQEILIKLICTGCLKVNIKTNLDTIFKKEFWGLGNSIYDIFKIFAIVRLPITSFCIDLYNFF